jgi:predicted DNA-binding transcriptional regulator YafY
MRQTKNETSTQTLTRLITALDKTQPVTVSYLKEEKDENGKRTGNLIETVRTIEIFNVIVTDAGHIVLRAMDRETGEMRSFRTDRIVSYTVHRTAYVIARPAVEETKTRVTVGLATVTVLYPIDCPATARVQILADALAA